MSNDKDDWENMFSEDNFQDLLKRRQQQEKEKALKVPTRFRDEDDLTKEEEEAIETARKLGEAYHKDKNLDKYRNVLNLIIAAERSTKEKISLNKSVELYGEILKQIEYVKTIFSDRLPTPSDLDSIELRTLAEDIYPDLEYKKLIINLHDSIEAIDFL